MATKLNPFSINQQLEKAFYQELLKNEKIINITPIHFEGTVTELNDLLEENPNKILLIKSFRVGSNSSDNLTTAHINCGFLYKTKNYKNIIIYDYVGGSNTFRLSNVTIRGSFEQKNQNYNLDYIIMLSGYVFEIE